MDYRTLTPEGQRQIARQALNTYEADHYRATLNLGQAEAIGNLEVADGLRETIAQAARLAKVAAAEVDRLDAVIAAAVAADID